MSGKVGDLSPAQEDALEKVKSDTPWVPCVTLVCCGSRPHS